MFMHRVVFSLLIFRSLGFSKVILGCTILRFVKSENPENHYYWVKSYLYKQASPIIESFCGD